MRCVPVVDKNQLPLMPTTCSRARKWIKIGKATGFFKKGVFCVRLNQEPSDNNKQEICVGIDIGICREAYAIKSASKTYLNILSYTVDWVNGAMNRRKNMRNVRRVRNTRSRKPRFSNRNYSKIVPSIRARWGLKLRICSWLKMIFPISQFSVEDVKANTSGKNTKWNKSFSPLQIGKNWFYQKLSEIAPVTTKLGWETKALRDVLGLKKSKKKLADTFDCHNNDSWVLANDAVGGHKTPDNKEILKIIPIQFHRRQLHVFNFTKGGKRRKYGGTRSMGFKRGSVVSHKKYNITYVGGTCYRSKAKEERISLHSLINNYRLTKDIKPTDCKFLSYYSWGYSYSL